MDFTSVTYPTYVSYYVKYEVMPNDGVNLQYSVNYGLTWTTLGLLNEVNWYNANIPVLIGPGKNSSPVALIFARFLWPRHGLAACCSFATIIFERPAGSHI